MLASMFDFLKPGALKSRWRKEAKMLYKGSKKFIHYKRDLLEPDRIAEIQSRREDLKRAMKLGDRAGAVEVGKQLRATCEKSLPRMPQQTWWEENVEVMFVALVVALGVRAYIIQPFRIPTGSMQPTLNGIIIDQQGDDFEPPWIGKRMLDYVFKGRTYKDILADRDLQVANLRDASWFLFTRTEVIFTDGSTIKLPSASGEVTDLVFVDTDGDGEVDTGKTYRKGEPILSGTITTGDLVLVDKVSYHFRRPERGEVFVFDTRGIPTKGYVSGGLAAQAGGQHYIKRLVGLPGDELSIDQPDLLNHGKLVNAPYIRRVAEREGIYGGPGRPGYQLAVHAKRSGHPDAPLNQTNEVFNLKLEAPPGLREYAAMGDNTSSSLDSRYWGAVHEYNIAGPALFSLWPFGSGHWGFIH